MARRQRGHERTHCPNFRKLRPERRRDGRNPVFDVGACLRPPRQRRDAIGVEGGERRTGITQELQILPMAFAECACIARRELDVEGGASAGERSCVRCQGVTRAAPLVRRGGKEYRRLAASAFDYRAQRGIVERRSFARIGIVEFRGAVEGGGPRRSGLVATPLPPSRKSAERLCFPRTIGSLSQLQAQRTAAPDPCASRPSQPLLRSGVVLCIVTGRNLCALQHDNCNQKKPNPIDVSIFPVEATNLCILSRQDALLRCSNFMHFFEFRG